MVDEAVLAWAVRERRWLLRQDRDYGELVCRSRMPTPTTLVYFRLPRPAADEVARRLLPLLEEAEQLIGRYVIVERARQRKRPLLRAV